MKIKIETYVYKIDRAINSFQLNVAIAQFYEVYKYFNDSMKFKIGRNVLIQNLIKKFFTKGYTNYESNDALNNMDPRLQEGIFEAVDTLRINLKELFDYVKKPLKMNFSPIAILQKIIGESIFENMQYHGI